MRAPLNPLSANSWRATSRILLFVAAESATRVAPGSCALVPMAPLLFNASGAAGKAIRRADQQRGSGSVARRSRPRRKRGARDRVRLEPVEPLLVERPDDLAVAEHHL